MQAMMFPNLYKLLFTNMATETRKLLFKVV